MFVSKLWLRCYVRMTDSICSYFISMLSKVKVKILQLISTIHSLRAKIEKYCILSQILVLKRKWKVMQDISMMLSSINFWSDLICSLLIFYIHICICMLLFVCMLLFFIVVCMLMFVCLCVSLFLCLFPFKDLHLKIFLNILHNKRAITQRQAIWIGYEMDVSFYEFQI